MSMDKLKALMVSYNKCLEGIHRSNDDRNSALLYGHMKGIEEVLSLMGYVFIKGIGGKMIDIKERVI